MRRRTDCFPDGHPGAEYSKGFVLTLRGPETVAILHPADCPHFHRGNSVPVPANVKTVAHYVEKLEQWAVKHHEAFRPCGACEQAGRL
jgi:hypothetical protein